MGARFWHPQVPGTPRHRTACMGATALLPNSPSPSSAAEADVPPQPPFFPLCAGTIPRLESTRLLLQTSPHHDCSLPGSSSPGAHRLPRPCPVCPGFPAEPKPRLAAHAAELRNSQGLLLRISPNLRPPLEITGRNGDHWRSQGSLRFEMVAILAQALVCDRSLLFPL